MYKVLITFCDTVNGGVYYRGDAYPRQGVSPTGERIACLAGNQNALGKPIIILAGVPPVEVDKTAKAQNKKKGRTVNVENNQNAVGDNLSGAG